MSNRTVGGKKQIQSNFKRVAAMDRIRQACECTTELLENRQLLTAVLAPVLPVGTTPATNPAPGQTYTIQGSQGPGPAPWANASAIKPVTTNDLISGSYAQIVDPVQTAQGGSANTIILNAADASTTAQLVGLRIELTGGTGAGQSGIILGYDPGSKTATVTANTASPAPANGTWNTVPDATTQYRVVNSNYAGTFETLGGDLTPMTDGTLGVGNDDPTSKTNALFDRDQNFQITYTLGGANPNPNGYDLTEIDSYTGHQDTRLNQIVDIEVQFAGSDTNFYSLSNGAGFTYEPNGSGSTQLSIIDSTGAGNAIVKNVKAIRFDSLDNDTQPGINEGPAYRELSVIGVGSQPAVFPTSAPVLSGNTTNGADNNLSWTDPDTTVTGFKVLRSVNGGPFTSIALVPATQLSYTDVVNQRNTAYSYQVVATNNGADSPHSNTVNLTSGDFGVTARFFGQQFWQGPVLATQTLGTIDQNHGDGTSPVPGTVPDQNFSSVFTGKVRSDAAGVYTFISNTDDDGYLYVNGQLVSSDPGGHGQRDPATGLISPIQLEANTTYDIVFLQNQGGGGSGFHLLWKEPLPDPNNPGGTITGPEVIVPGDHLSPTTTSALPTVNSVSASSFGGVVTLFWSINGTDTTSAYYRVDRQVVDSNGNPLPGTQPVTIAKVRSVANGSSTEGANTFNDNSAIPGQNYTYTVTPVGFDGTAGATSTPSNVASVSTANQTTGVEERDYANQWWYSNGDPHNIEIIHTADHVSTQGNIDAKWNENLPNGSPAPASPDPSIPSTNWSNIYTGKILTDQAGVYTFISNTDDDGYLFINDGTSSSYKLVSQDPGGHGERNASTLIPVTLAASTSYNFIFLHSQGGGGAGAHLEWIEPSFTGTAQGPGTGTNTLVVSTATAAGPTAFVNGTITITGGTGKGQAGTITSYDPTTGTVFVNVTTGGTADPNSPGNFNWTTPPDATSTYTIIGIVPAAGSTSPGATGGLLQVMDTPDAPTALTNPAGQLDPNFVGLTWTDNAKSEVNYVIERATDQNFTTNDKIVGTIGFDTNSFVDGSVQAGQTYFYRVYAKNFDSQSAPATISVTVPAVAVQTPGAEQHLYNDQYWNGNNGDPLAINQSGPPVAGGWVSNIDRNYGNFSPDPRIRLVNNSQVFTGKILTDQAGVYTLVTNTDDEGFLFLSNPTTGWQLVSSDPGGHGQQDASTTARSQDWLVPVTLAANTAYNFVFFQNQGGGGQGAHLRWNEPNFNGTAQGAGTGANTIVLATTTTGALVGGTITITGGTGKGSIGTITAFDPTTGTATVNVTTQGTNGNWNTKPDATSTYTIVAPIPAAGTGTGGLEAIQDTPAAPATLAATVGSTAVQLTWSEPASGSELTWVVERATQPDFSNATVIGTTGMTLDKFTDTTVTAGQTYFYRVHGTNFDGSGAAATVTATTHAAATGGIANAFVDPVNAPNLNNYGTLDWAHWATNNPGDFTHKASGGNQISDVTVLGAPTELQSPPLRNSQGGFPGASWASSDPGLLIRTNGGNGNAVMVHDLGDGFELTAPADATSRVLRLWLAVTNGTGTVTARLSDGSAVATQTISNAGTAAAGVTTRDVVSIVYSAPASSGSQFLIVDYKLTADGGNGNVALSSASLGSPADFPPPSNIGVVRYSDGEMDITWQDNTLNPNNDNGFEIQYSTDNTNFTTLATVGQNVTSYHVTHDQGLVPSTQYFFRIRAVGAGTQAPSAFSPTFTAAPEANPLVFTDFNSGTGVLQKNGNGSLNTGTGGNPAKALEITSQNNSQNTSIFTRNRYDMSQFNTTFDFEYDHLAANPQADGFTFTMQTNGSGALGGGGGSMGYSGAALSHSVAIKFDIWNGGPNDSTTGVFDNGEGLVDTLATPQTAPGQLHKSYSMEASGIKFHANFADKFEANLKYDGTTLTETVTDLTTQAVFTMTYVIDIVTILGNKSAFVGFTGATGGANAQQDILNWNLQAAPYVPVVNQNNNTVTGTAGNDTITIKVDGTNPALDDISVTNAGGTTTQTADNTKTIIINGGGGTDTLVIDSTNGQPIPAGATGLQLNQTAGGSYTLGGTPPTLDATHTVDVTNSTVNIPYTGTSILPAVQSQLKNKFIFSSTANGSSGKFAIADTDTGSQIALNYRVIGDLNGDGTVAFGDLLALAQHYNNTGVDWSKGDLNYDGSVNFSDLLALAQHYNASAAAAPAVAAASPTLAAQTLDSVLTGKKARKH